jgi:hypothetical protein
LILKRAIIIFLNTFVSGEKLKVLFFNGGERDGACDIAVTPSGLHGCGVEARLLVDEHRVVMQVEVTANPVARHLNM